MNIHTRIIIWVGIIGVPLLILWPAKPAQSISLLKRGLLSVIWAWLAIVLAIWLDEPGVSLHGEEYDVAIAFTEKGWIFGAIWAAPFVFGRALWQLIRKHNKPNKAIEAIGDPGPPQPHG